MDDSPLFLVINHKIQYKLQFDFFCREKAKLKICIHICMHLHLNFSTPGTAAHQTSLSFTISQSLFKLMPIELAMPPNLLILCYSLLLPSIFPSIRVFSSESVLCIKWPKYWSFSFSKSLSNEYSGLTSSRIDCFILLAVEEL